MTQNLKKSPRPLNGWSEKKFEVIFMIKSPLNYSLIERLLRKKILCKHAILIEFAFISHKKITGNIIQVVIYLYEIIKIINFVYIFTILSLFYFFSNKLCISFICSLKLIYK